MAKQTRRQKRTVGRVMHEFKHGELKTRGRKVKNPKQAIAIALGEAGASNRKSPRQNARAAARTKEREQQGRTARAQAERGKAAAPQRGAARTGRGKTAPAQRGAGRAAARGGARGTGPTRAELYAEASRRNIQGRSRMSKADLQKALKRR